MSVFEHDEFSDHECVCFISDQPTNLRAIIAVHNTVLGPSAGGIRFFLYQNSEQALCDVLRLSKAMTYKFSLAGISLGGGKSVIMGNPKTDKTESLLEAFGKAVDRLGGRYTCAEDVGMSPDDMTVIHRQTKFVAGLPGKSGDTSPPTAYGVYQAILAGVSKRLGREDLTGVSVAVQGVGNVGWHLCKLLKEAGARIYVADVDKEAVLKAVDAFGLETVGVEEILYLDTDVLAPCALGAVLNDRTIHKIQAKIICGAANNQLAEESHGKVLMDRNILYVPDFVANAGGAISGSRDITGASESEAKQKIEAIYATCNQLFSFAEKEGIPMNEAANRLAEEVIRSKILYA